MGAGVRADWAVPGPDADWRTVSTFALEVNGYALYDRARLPWLAQALRRRWQQGQALPPQVEALRAALFWEQRRIWHLGEGGYVDETPTGATWRYLQALVAAIRTAVDGLTARAQGTLVGQVVGDALGSQVEFAAAEDLWHRFPDGLRTLGPSPIWGTIAGQPTDDSELAWALADAVVGNRGRWDATAVTAGYGHWLRSDRLIVDTPSGRPWRPWPRRCDRATGRGWPSGPGPPQTR